ncbi:7TM diverse intracellular signaling domain-containing protein [Poseidonibacter antarcticus]|uniref:7TM diverse intracellular signaling domain-containing protein n=1 Tax=Poseidonibacter antarcticus TaxID=2478538 RepID=UPI000EF4E5DB|nr:7TM diverse intracellular signaling domain-containing protein [Poseidonibacter antarcticus]
MKKNLFILLIFLSSLYGQTIDINDNSSIEILSKSEIYIDNTKNDTINNIVERNLEFVTLNTSIKRYGYYHDFNIWIKFTLHNLEKKTITKILEFDNPLVTDIFLFENNSLIRKEGLLNKTINRNSINPIFEINLKKNETKTYYMKVSSKVTSLTLKLNIFSANSFYSKEILHQIVLSFFFGAMIILALYNFSIFIIIKDVSYLYYVGYIGTLVFHHSLYVGFANLYIFDNSVMKYLVDYAAIFISLPVLFLSLFSKRFLMLEQYIKINIILNILIFILIISVFFFTFSNYLVQCRNIVPIVVMLYLFIITLYAFIKKNMEAKLILFGWTAILFAGLIMYLSSSGILNINLSNSYIIEVSFVLEALIFSIALASRIRKLLEEKNRIKDKLISEQKNIEKKLNRLVIEKTNNLKISLEQKDILLKELNHRVKNNMQTIISLIRLQNDEIDDFYINSLLTTIQNRISAMSHLHELLYKKDAISFVNGCEYFEKIIFEVEESFDKNIQVESNIKGLLSSESAVYCGLVINELITNSFKHGFNNEDSGKINITLFNTKGEYHLLYRDNGRGYNPLEKKESLGLTLIETLVKKQLKASLKMESINGVNIEICWKELNDKNIDS